MARILMILIVLINHYLVLLLATSKCSIQSNDIYCAHIQNYDSLSAALLQIKVDQVQNDHAVFRRLHIVNSSLETLPANAFLGLKFATILLENVQIRKFHNNAFGPSAEYIKRFIHQNKANEYSCPKFTVSSGYNLFEALRRCRYLQFLELCLTNDNETIPSGALNHSYLRTIRFNGNYSKYSVDSRAFDELKRIKMIVFNKVTIDKIGESALDVTSFVEQNLVSFNSVNIVFNRCKFQYDLKRNFGTNFISSNKSKIGLYFYSMNLISVKSVTIFEKFLKLSSNNSLYLTKLNCDSLIDDSHEYFKLKKLVKIYRNQLQIKCSQDKSFWKSFLEKDENWFNKSTGSSSNESSVFSENASISNSSLTSSLFTMYSMLMQRIVLFSVEPNHHQSDTAPELPKSVKHRWFKDLSYLLEQWKSFFTADGSGIWLLLQMLDQSALIALDEIHHSINRVQMEQNENIQCSVSKLKATQAENPVVEVSHSGDAVQIVENPKSTELYLVSTVAQFDGKVKNTTAFHVNSNLISVNLVDSLQNRSRIHNATVKIKFHNLHARHLGDQVNCVFWNFTTSQWSPSGCVYLPSESDPRTTVCQCTHLTNFAALLDVSGREDNQELKSTLTYIFCSASVLCLTISLALSFRLGRKESYNLVNDQFRRRANKYVINLNIAICLLITNFVTLVGMDRKEIESVCLSFSMTLSFFLLSTFSFMLLQGYHLLKSTSNPLVSDLKHGNYFAFGYGIPAGIMVTTVMIIWSRQHSLSDVFIGDFFCWISTKKDPLYIFIIIVPISLAIFTNSIFFLLILLNLIRHNRFVSNFTQSFHPHSHTNQHLNLRKQSFSLVLLIFNFGISWIVFMFYITEHGNYFAYIFIVLNGSQGVFFLLNQILFLQSKKVPIFKHRFTRPNSRVCSITTQTSSIT